MKEYMLRRYHERMADAKAQLGGKCVSCGSSKDLEFDHIDPNTKSYSVQKMWSLSKAKLEAELAKCQLMCKTCLHDRETPCGTPQKYWRGCRCAECANAKNAYEREYKKSRKSG